jgi:serine/threonine-protein kinase
MELRLAVVELGQIDVGQIVAGKYELARLLGKGAMGEVWLAKHRSLGGEFAIKLVRPEAQDADDSAIARFQQEAQVSAKLSRKTRHIVSVSDHGEEGGLAYLVMELLEGQSLETRIVKGGPLDLPEATAIVTQVARALGQAHAEDIVHRDLKPANVFLTHDEDGRLLVKLLDFGIARTTKPGEKRSPFATGKDMVLGTPSYMSPEQARGLPSLDHRCDLWALAVVAYEALTGTIPWQGESIEDIFLSICTFEWTPIRARRADLPVGLEGFFARAFAEKLGSRFSTAAELSEAFVGLVDPVALEQVRASPLSSADLLERPSLSLGSQGSDYEPGAEPLDSGVHQPTMMTRQRRLSGGRLLALLLAAAVIGVVVITLFALQMPDKEKDKAKLVPSEPATAVVDRANIPPPEPAPTVATVITPATTDTPKGPTHPTARTAPSVRATAAAPPSTPAPPPPVVTAAPPPTTPPAPTPPPTATTRPPPDKSQVF